MAQNPPTQDLTFPRTYGDRVVTDPYPGFAMFREAGPVHFTEVVDGVEAWVVTDHENVMRVLTDHETFSSNPKNAPRAWLEKFSLLRDANGDFIIAENMLYADPPVHTRLRRLVSKVFVPSRVAAMRPFIERTTTQILDRLAPRGQAELVYDFALLVPLTVICELLGMPEADRAQFQTWSNELMVGRPVAPEQVDQAQWKILGYLAELIQAKRREPGDDLLSDLIRVHDEGDQLNDIELVSMAALLFIAGQETAGNIIGNGLLELMREPARLTALRDNPDLVPGAVDEFLRLVSPAMGTWRFTVADAQIAGVTVPAGQAVLPLLASANRDASRFPHADDYDPLRSRDPHVAFGHGIHYCLGAPLGRMEAEIAVGAAVRRLSGLSLAVPWDELRWRPSLMRGLLELPVTFTAEPVRPAADEEG